MILGIGPDRHSSAPASTIGFEVRAPSLGTFRALAGTGIICAYSVMSEGAPPKPYAPRWHALLAEHAAIQDALSAAAEFTKPLSPEQINRVKTSAARFVTLSRQLRALVNEWSADARPS